MNSRVPYPELLLWVAVGLLSLFALVTSAAGGAWALDRDRQAVDSRRAELELQLERETTRAGRELSAWLAGSRELALETLPSGWTIDTVLYRNAPPEPRSLALLEIERSLVAGRDAADVRRALRELTEESTASPADRVRGLRHLARLDADAAPELLGRALALDDSPETERFRALFELARIDSDARRAFLAELETGFTTVDPGERAFLAEQLLDHDELERSSARSLRLLDELLAADETDRLRPSAGTRSDELAFVVSREDRHTLVHGPAVELLEHLLPGIATARWQRNAKGPGITLPAPLPEGVLVLGERSLSELEAAGRSARLESGWIVGFAVALLLATIAWLVVTLVRRRRLAPRQFQNDFLYAVTHELKTPLATISLSAETLLEHGESDPSAVPRFSRMIVDEAERLRVRIQQVLDVAAGRREAIDPSGSFDPGELLHAVVADYLPGARESGVDLELLILDDCPELRGSSELFAQAVGGLLENAIKFSRQGTVKVITRVEDSTFSVFVRDQGPGIPAREAERIFEPFVRLGSEATREVDGTGLGLTLVRQCASALNGRVQVVRQEGPGAVFRLDLPCDTPGRRS